MGLACKISGHKWNGCTCTRCGEHREEGHAYHIEVQMVEQYGLRKRSCRRVCSICGTSRIAEHDWNGCMCARCDEKRNSDHSWGPPRAGDEHTRDRETHHLVRCTRCGKSEFRPHTFEQVEKKGRRRCAECGYEVRKRPKFKTPEAESDYYANLIASGKVGFYDMESKRGQIRVTYGAHVTTIPALTRLFIAALANNNGADNVAPQGIARKLKEIASDNPGKADAVDAAFAQMASDERVHIWWRSWVLGKVQDKSRYQKASESIERWHAAHPRSQADIDYENAMIAMDSGLGRSG